MDRVGGDLLVVAVEGLGQDLEGEAGGDAGHAFGDARGLAIFLHRLGLGVGVLQAVAVVDAKLRIERRVLVLLEAAEDAEAREDLEHLGRAGRLAQFAAFEQLGVDHRLFGHPEAVGHLDDADAVEERLVVLVVLEVLPLRFIGMGEHDPLERQGSKVLGARVIAFLGRRQQRMQHLDRRLEHLDEFQQALRRTVEAAGIAVGVRVVLGEVLELADVDLADEGGDVLVVLVTRFGLGDGDLAQPGRIDLDHGEPGDVAVEGVEALGRPRRADAGEPPRRDAVAALEDGPHCLRAEEAKRRFEHRAHFVAGGEHVDRLGLHQRLKALGERGLSAADRAEQIEDLLALLQPLRGVLEIAHHALDRVLHAEEPGKGGKELDRAVEENAAETLVLGRVDDDRLADGGDHAFGGARRHAGIVAAPLEKVGQAHRLAPLARIGRREQTEDVRASARRGERGLLRTHMRECVAGLGVHGGSPTCLRSSSISNQCGDELLTKTVDRSRLGRRR